MIDAAGFQSLTLLDYPGRLAATVFTRGCNFRCPFCHNASLVLEGKGKGAPDALRVLEYLDKRKDRLSGLCVSGGEPLLQPGLAGFLSKVKALGYHVKVDTNGSLPEELASLISAGLVDSVAMDIKNAPDRYARTAGLSHRAGQEIVRAVEKSIDVLRSSDIEVEFRTTVVRQFHDRNSLLALARWLSGSEPYYLQQFVDSGDTIEPDLSAYDQVEMMAFQDVMRPHISSVRIRGL